MLFALFFFPAWKKIKIKTVWRNVCHSSHFTVCRKVSGEVVVITFYELIISNVENYLLECDHIALRTDQNPTPISKCCSRPLVFRGWKWPRRCSRAQVAGLAISSARPWCVLATLHNHISPLSEQQGCCAAQQQRQQQHKLLELSRAAPDRLTESVVLISSLSFGCHLVHVFIYDYSSCCGVNYNFECFESHESSFGYQVQQLWSSLFTHTP